MAIPGLSGARKILTITSTAGTDALLMLGMKGQERLGRLPRFELDMVSGVDMLGKPKDIDLHALIGTRATVKLELDGMVPMQRYWDGYIVRAERGERHGRFVRYTAVLRPWLWFMTRTRNSRVFQSMTVKDILAKVLGEYSPGAHEMRLLMPKYPTLDYCVQHNETDFDFVSRLMERFGIYYFFEHTSSKHTMVLVDLTITHKPKQNPMPIFWSGALKQGQSVTDWKAYEEVRSQKVVISDYDYLGSSTAIKAEKAATSPPAKVGKMEFFEHSPGVVQNSQKDKAAMLLMEPADAAKVLIEEQNSLQAAYSGLTNQRDMAVGATFILADLQDPAENGMYLMVDAKYSMTFAQHEAVEDLKGIDHNREGFRCDFIAINSLKGTFRPERSTPRPRIYGPQTAIVVGAAGNEIETDTQGRIKVQFRWDREGKKDANSSCWLRVATPWAGKGFGMFALPRVGHEVVVSFLEGDPDRPLVTGSVYNDQNMMAWKMPDNATFSGVVTRSSKGGKDANCNEIRFEDKKDNEYIWIQAEKNFYRHVKGDAFDFVEKNDSVRIGEIRKVAIGKSLYTDIKEETMTHVGKDLHLTVGADMLVNVKTAHDMKIGKDWSLKVGGNAGIDVTGKTDWKSGKDISFATGTAQFSIKGLDIVIEASKSITLKAGGSTITIGGPGVTIDGALVKLNCGGSGGSAKSASPKAAAEAKKDKSDELTKSAYTDKFKDPNAK